MILPHGWILTAQTFHHFEGEMFQVRVENREKQKLMTFIGEAKESEKTYKAAVEWANKLELI